MMVTTNVLYRYQNTGDVVLLEHLPIQKRTDKGCWIWDGYKRRFVVESVKRYAYPTLELAKEGFLARKRRQLSILRAQQSAVEAAVLAMQEGRIADYSRSPYFEFD